MRASPIPPPCLSLAHTRVSYQIHLGPHCFPLINPVFIRAFAGTFPSSLNILVMFSLILFHLSMTNRIIFSVRTNGGVESLGGLALEQGDEVGAGSGPRPAEAAEEAQPGRGRCWSLGLRAGPQPGPGCPREGPGKATRGTQ